MSEFAAHDPERKRLPRLSESEGLKIRPASEADLHELAEIAANREGGPAERWRRSFQRLLEEARAGRALVLAAALGARVIGFGKAAYFTPPAGSPSNVAPEGWYLSGLVVRPGDRDRGVGARLTASRLAWIAERGDRAYYFANARNQVTIDLHRALDFVEVTRDFSHPGARFEGGVGILFVRELGKRGKTAGPPGRCLPRR